MKITKSAQQILKSLAKASDGLKKCDRELEAPARELERFDYVEIFEEPQGVVTTWGRPGIGPITLRITVKGLDEAEPSWKRASKKLVSQWPSVVVTGLLAFLV
jgi:hypothetical protein